MLRRVAIQATGTTRIIAESRVGRAGAARAAATQAAANRNCHILIQLPSLDDESTRSAEAELCLPLRAPLKQWQNPCDTKRLL